jgi:hypothetical protein
MTMYKKRPTMGDVALWGSIGASVQVFLVR